MFFFVVVAAAVVCLPGVLEPRLGEPGHAAPTPGRLAGEARQPDPAGERGRAGDVLQPPRGQEGAPHGALVGARGVQQRQRGCEHPASGRGTARSVVGSRLKNTPTLMGVRKYAGTIAGVCSCVP